MEETQAELKVPASRWTRRRRLEAHRNDTLDIPPAYHTNCFLHTDHTDHAEFTLEVGSIYVARPGPLSSPALNHKKYLFLLLGAQDWTCFLMKSWHCILFSSIIPPSNNEGYHDSTDSKGKGKKQSNANAKRKTTKLLGWFLVLIPYSSEKLALSTKEETSLLPVLIEGTHLSPEPLTSLTGLYGAVSLHSSRQPVAQDGEGAQGGWCRLVLDLVLGMRVEGRGEVERVAN